MNSELYNKQYKIPPDVLKYIQTTLISNSSGDGVKRAKYLLKNGNITYQAMKRLKNFFDTFNPQVDNKVQYALAGGDLMKSFINTSLDSDRHAIKSGKNSKLDMSTNYKSGLKPYRTPNLNESDKKLDKNVVVVIVNDDNKILLLKRGDSSKIWMPNKWSLVGGGVDKNENPQNACKREIKEETGLDISTIVKTFTIERNLDSVEYVFACRYNGDSTDVILNYENTNYGWYSVDEMVYLDTVPHLIEYITLVFKPY